MVAMLLAQGINHILRLLGRIVVDTEDTIPLLPAQSEDTALVPPDKVGYPVLQQLSLYSLLTIQVAHLAQFYLIIYFYHTI